MNNIVYISGNKGGVGKSMAAIALADHVKHKRSQPVLLIETDTANPDVAKCLKDELDAVLAADTRTELGWQKMLNTIETNRGMTCIINAGARDNEAMLTYGEYLHLGAEALGARLNIAWVINDERDSLVALRDFLGMYSGIVHVLGNQYFDEAGDFTLYRDSKVREEIERRGGSLLPFPRLPKQLAAEIKSNRRSPAQIIGTAPLFERIALERWRNLCSDTFTHMLGQASPAAARAVPSIA